MNHQTIEPTSSQKNLRAMVCVMAAAALWGCIGLFNRSLSAMGISSVTIVLLRNVGALILMAVLFFAMDRSIFRIHLHHLPFFFGTGVVSILFFTLCYFRSQEITSLSTAAILLYTSPAFVLLLSALLFRDALTGRKLLALVITFLGCIFATGVWSGGMSLSVQGLLLGLGSGFFYGLYSIFGRYALAYYQPLTVTFYTFLFAGLGSLFLVRPAELSIVFHHSHAALLTVGLIVLSTVLPYLLYTRGLRDLGDSGKAAILASVEPVVATFVGILVFGEPMGIGVIAGLICILIAVFILK